MENDTPSVSNYKAFKLKKFVSQYKAFYITNVKLNAILYYQDKIIGYFLLSTQYLMSILITYANLTKTN